jgi:hypothetical protein
MAASVVRAGHGADIPHAGACRPGSIVEGNRVLKSAGFILSWTLALVTFAACSSGDSTDEAQRDAATSTQAAAPATAASPADTDLWRPASGTTWQWQLDGEIDTSVDVDAYDVDLFETPQSTIDALHEGGRIVICYFSAGSLEEGREDESEFTEDDYANQLENWPDERWLDVRSSNVRRIMEQRLDLAVEKRCDAVEPDNVDSFQNDSGFPLTAGDQVEYNTFLAEAAHARGLSIGLKNALDLVPELEPHFDWALNEECYVYDECDALAPFLVAGKAVFHVEYVGEPDDGPALREELCGDAAIAGFSTLIKTPELDAWRLAC